MVKPPLYILTNALNDFPSLDSINFVTLANVSTEDKEEEEEEEEEEEKELLGCCLAGDGIISIKLSTNDS